MCRYSGFGCLLSHYICLDCRVGFKGRHMCPHCRKPMHYAGLDLRVPRRTKLKAWRQLQMLVAAGVSFSSGCGCSGPGYIPRTMLDTKIHLAERGMPRRYKRTGSYKERPKFRI